MIEAIAVVAIMAILAVLIGSLLASSSSFYTNEKNLAAAKEVSKVIEKEIKRLMVYKEYVYLQDFTLDINGGITTDLPEQGSIIVDGKEYNPNNKPNPEVAMFYSHPETGVVMYKQAYYDINSGFESYFGSTASEIEAFYGGMKVDLSFKAVGGGNGKYQSLLIIASINDKNGKLLYQSQGTVVELKNLTKTGNGFGANEIKSFSITDYVAGSATYNYQNLISGTSEYSCLIFA